MNCRWTTQITTNPEILTGKPIIAGTRISVELILDCMASGWSVDKVVEAYPHITPQNVFSALAFAADVLRKKPFVTISEIESLVKGDNNFDLCP